jgi:23S rRNA (cytosine1962-C5)-methyltransferase
MLPDPLDPHATHPQSPDADPTLQPGLEPGPGRETATESDSRPPASGPAPTPSGRRTPWVQLKTYTNHPTVYPAMVRGASPGAKGGDLVTVYDKEGREFAAGLWNPKARVPLRVVHHGPEGFTEADFLRLLDHAVDLRLNTLGFGSSNDTDAYRVIHSDGDALSGLIVDRFADVLSVSVHSLGVFQRLPVWIPHLHSRLGTKRVVVEVDENIARIEGISVRRFPGDTVRSVKIREHGIRYEVDFAQGHKTGFFCDQRENRRRFARLTGGKRVLELCSYTGGFSLCARILGGASDVIGVDLDEHAVEQAKRNANLNQARVNFVHCDAFTWARQMQKNGERWDVVLLDPPKLVFDREDPDGGYRKYEDLNIIGLSLVRPGGIFVTCSCSGMVDEERFERVVIKAAHRQGKRLQFLETTGAGPDHPVMSNCPESRYLKVFWTRVHS